LSPASWAARLSRCQCRPHSNAKVRKAHRYHFVNEISNWARTSKKREWVQCPSCPFHPQNQEIQICTRNSGACGFNNRPGFLGDAGPRSLTEKVAGLAPAFIQNVRQNI
jgi:hypothetical protein